MHGGLESPLAKHFLWSNDGESLVLIWTNIRLSCLLSPHCLYTMYSLYTYLFCLLNRTQFQLTEDRSDLQGTSPRRIIEYSIKIWSGNSFHIQMTSFNPIKQLSFSFDPHLLCNFTFCCVGLSEILQTFSLPTSPSVPPNARHLLFKSAR